MSKSPFIYISLEQRAVQSFFVILHCGPSTAMHCFNLFHLYINNPSNLEIICRTYMSYNYVAMQMNIVSHYGWYVRQLF